VSETSTDTDLLRTCVQDLYAGCSAFARKFPAITTRAETREQRADFEQLANLAEARGRRLELVAEATGGPDNLWMAGMLDDAVRDTQTIASGRLLHIALIGAVRKMLVAELVSVETAIVLARKLAYEKLINALRTNHTELRYLDNSLSSALQRTVGCNITA
jgi:ferritin-like metal-binding protein YciE